MDNNHHKEDFATCYFAPYLQALFLVASYY